MQVEMHDSRKKEPTRRISTTLGSGEQHIRSTNWFTMTGFINGITAYANGIRILTRYRLWGFTLIPGLISALLGFLIFQAAWVWSDDVGGWISSLWPFDWGKATLLRIANVFGALLIGAAGLIVFKQIVLALASPFMSFLSENIEKRMATGRSVPFSLAKAWEDLVRGIRISLRNIIQELFYSFLLLLLGLIPIFSPFVAVAIFLVQAYYAGFGNMDYTLERYYKVRDSVHFVRRNRGFAIGNGTIFLLLLFTGIGFLFALPLATAAATPEVLKRMKLVE